MARPKIPHQVVITNVPQGAFASSSGGNYLVADSTLTASLSGVDAALFSILQLDTFDIESEPDTRPPQLVLVPAITVAGAGPIDAFAGEAILATVGFTCPADPLKPTYHAIATLAGTGLPAPISVPVTATPQQGLLEAVNTADPPISAGGTEKYSFRVASSFGHDISIAFRYDTQFEPLFSASTQFPPPIPAHGSVDFDVDITCASNTPPGLRNVTFQMFSPDGTQAFGSMAFGIPVVLPPPPPHVPVDLSIIWQEATDLSIAVNRDPNVNAWNAGHLNDILIRSDGIFVASSTGGVWGIDPQDSGAGCTTDNVDNPNFNCMALGPDSPLQIYAGCASMQLGARPGTGLYLRGLSEWRAVPIIDRFNNPILTDDIYRILVLPAHRVILLATMRGVFIAPIPASIGQPHVFDPVASLPSGSYSGMCAGPNESVVVSRWGPDGGIFVGIWSGSGITFSAAQLIPDPSQADGDIDLEQVTRTSLAACGANPSVMYAAFAGLNERIYRILRSDSGGASWRPLRNLGFRAAQDSTAPLAPDTDANDMAGTQGTYNNCIAVGFHDPNEAAIGWKNGPWLTSNGGDFLTRWTLAYEEANNDNVHGDLHFILFDPTDPSGNTIYAASDGGLMVTFDRAGDVGYQSHISMHLRNLQFYAGVAVGNGATGFAGGGMSASPVTAGLIAGPTQDNGNIFCDLESADSRAWQVLDGGDGVATRFLANGWLLSVAPNRHAQLSRWSGAAFIDRTDVPVTSPTSNVLSVTGDVQAVTHPSFVLPGSAKQLIAVASTSNAGGQLINTYGLFSDGVIANAEWQLIATLPLQDGDQIASVASLNGHQVFAGTVRGRVFSFAPFQIPFELVVSPADKGTVHDIVVIRDALAFALYDGPTTKAILQSEFFNWDPLGSNQNVARGLFLDSTESFVGLTVDRQTSPFTLYACTDSRIFVSGDEGDTWALAPTQLPRRVHCTGLCVGAARPSGRYLYLSTYGRSVWQAPI